MLPMRFLTTLQRAALAAVPLLIGCAKGSTGPSDDATPVPGWLSIELETPNPDDGAVQLRVTGAAVEEVRVGSIYNGFGVGSTSGADLVITGVVGQGVVAQIRVPDVNRSGRYTASVVAVARRGNYELRSPGGYRAAITR